MTRAYLKKFLIKEQKRGGKESKNEKKGQKSGSIRLLREFYRMKLKISLNKTILKAI